MGYIDDWHTGAEVVGTLETVRRDFAPDRYPVGLAIGYKDLNGRRQAAGRLRDAGYRIASLVHPQAYVSENVVLGEGSIVMAQAAIDVGVDLGPLTVVWPGAVISHDCHFLGNTFVSPNATVCGHCTVGEDSFLGAGSIVVDHLELPPKSFLKAGEVWKGVRPDPDEARPAGRAGGPA